MSIRKQVNDGKNELLLTLLTFGNCLALKSQRYLSSMRELGSILMDLTPYASPDIAGKHEIAFGKINEFEIV